MTDLKNIMTFRYTRIWTYLDLASAFAMSLAFYIGLQPKWWGWLLFAPLFLYMTFESIRKYRYSLTVNDDHISVTGFHSARYSIADITEVNDWIAKGGHIGAVNFADGRRLTFSGRLARYDELVRLLRTKANLTKAHPES